MIEDGPLMIRILAALEDQNTEKHHQVLIQAANRLSQLKTEVEVLRSFSNDKIIRKVNDRLKELGIPHGY
jgi:hypothetical protein